MKSIVRVTVGKMFGKWMAHLKVGCQGFWFGYRCDSRKQAEWYAKMMRIAITKIKGKPRQRVCRCGMQHRAGEIYCWWCGGKIGAK